MVKWWKQRTVSPDAFPYIAVLSPNYAKTEVVDAAWIYQQNSASNYVVRGVQDKLGRTVPSAEMPDGMLGLLMRGKAPSTGKQAKGWVYPRSRDIRDFLGASLSAPLSFLTGLLQTEADLSTSFSRPCSFQEGVL